MELKENIILNLQEDEILNLSKTKQAITQKDTLEEILKLYKNSPNHHNPDEEFLLSIDDFGIDLTQDKTYINIIYDKEYGNNDIFKVILKDNIQNEIKDYIEIISDFKYIDLSTKNKKFKEVENNMKEYLDNLIKILNYQLLPEKENKEILNSFFNQLGSNIIKDKNKFIMSNLIYLNNNYKEYITENKNELKRLEDKLIEEQYNLSMDEILDLENDIYYYKELIENSFEFYIKKEFKLPENILNLIENISKDIDIDNEIQLKNKINDLSNNDKELLIKKFFDDEIMFSHTFPSSIEEYLLNILNNGGIDNDNIIDQLSIFENKDGTKLFKDEDILSDYRESFEIKTKDGIELKLFKIDNYDFNFQPIFIDTKKELIKVLNNTIMVLKSEKFSQESWIDNIKRDIKNGFKIDDTYLDKKIKRNERNIKEIDKEIEEISNKLEKFRGNKNLEKEIDKKNIELQPF
jgi:hypothetical protein